MYWRLNSCSARSSAERSNMRDSAMPISFSAFFSVSLSNSLVPVNVDLADRRPLLDDDDQHAVLGFETHIAKKAGRIQGFDGGRGLLIVDAIADLDRQVTEHSSRFGALHALDADILDDKRLECQRG